MLKVLCTYKPTKNIKPIHDCDVDKFIKNVIAKYNSCTNEDIEITITQSMVLDALRVEVMRGTIPYKDIILIFDDGYQIKLNKDGRYLYEVTNNTTISKCASDFIDIWEHILARLLGWEK